MPHRHINKNKINSTICNKRFVPTCILCKRGHYIWECYRFIRNQGNQLDFQKNNSQHWFSSRNKQYFFKNRGCNNEFSGNGNKSNGWISNYNCKTLKKINCKAVNFNYVKTCPRILVNFNKLSCPALLDSGSARTIIAANFLEKLKAEGVIKEMKDNKITCYTASNTPLIINKSVDIKLRIEHFTWVFSVLVADKLSCDFIIGADFFDHSRLVLDVHGSQFYFKFSPKFKIPFYNPNSPNDSKPTLKFSSINSEKFGDTPLYYSNELTQDQQNQVDDLRNEFSDVLTKRLGLTTLIEYDIKLKDREPVKSHPYVYAPPKMEFLREHIKGLLEAGIVEPSDSPYASPCFIVTKEGRKPRMVVDYRKLNMHVEVEAVPLPNINSCFDWFKGAKFFTVLDLNSAYHQIPLSQKSKHVTAFVTPWMLYHYNRIPFGLCTGGQVLTRLLDKIFSDIKFDFVFNYLDDLVIFSKSWEEHIKHVREVLTRLRGANLTVNPEKVKFGAQEISFLGHLVSAQGVRIDPERTLAIKNFPRPKDAKGIARFIGMINYFRKFIPNFSEVAAPLNALRQKNIRFVWGPEQDEAFEKLKEIISDPPVLRSADFDKPFILQTDASSCALGAVLIQEVDGVRQPVAYASRTLSLQEKKACSAYELECLAVVFGIDKFRPYLEHREFLLETDNQALSWLLARPRSLDKLGRWITKIMSMKFRVSHIRGTQNVVADALSRMFNPDEVKEEEPVLCASILTGFPLAFADLERYQAEDQQISEIRDKLKNGQSDDKFCLSKGVVCLKDSQGKPTRIYLPTSLVDMVFSYFHDSPIGGHLGFFKTNFKIRTYFFWPKMSSEIKKRIGACDTCATSKPARNTKIGALASLPPSRPFHTLHIDHVGKLPRSKSGNTYILVVVDTFTKFVWLCPVREATSASTIKALSSHIFQHFGFPQNIISDNATCFTSNLFRNFCFTHGIKHSTFSPYHPQPSHAERFNRNLKASLIAYHSDSQTSWDQSLLWLQLAFNSAKHEAHQDTPFNLLFKFNPNSPLTLAWHINDLLPSSCQDIKSIWHKARSNLVKARKKYAKEYNKSRIPNPFKVNDLVWCQTHFLSSAVEKRAAKLMPRWSGPFLILDFLTPVTVALGSPSDRAFVKKVHISHLKPCFQQNDVSVPDPP